jgi:predicted transcriptional regulator
MINQQKEIRDMMLSFRASASMKMAVDVAAQNRGLSRTEWLREAVRRELAMHAAEQAHPRPVTAG